jgi:hypothetical protein
MERKENFATLVPPTPAEVRAASTEWRRRGPIKRLARVIDPGPPRGGSA